MRAVPVLDKDFQIVIPTHARPSKQITLARLSPDLRAKVLVVTSLEKEAKAIRRNYQDIGYGAVVSVESFGDLETHGQRIHTKRQWILENVKSRNIMQMDDDLYFFQRCPPKYRAYVNGQWKLTDEGRELGKKLLYTATEKRISVAFHRFIEIFLEKGYVHGGFGSRMGNDKEEPEVDFVGGRLMHCLAHNRKTLLDKGITFDEVAYREDFNVTLHLLRRGYKALRVFNFAVSPNSYQAPGGCATYRTTEESDKAAFRLALLHPGFVKPVEKQYKESPRLEVQVAWMKALDSKRTEVAGHPDGENWVRAKDCPEGFYRVKAYTEGEPLWSYNNGKRWSTPTLNKPNLPTNPGRHTRIPFKVKAVK